MDDYLWIVVLLFLVSLILWGIILLARRKSRKIFEKCYRELLKIYENPNSKSDK